MESNQYKPDHPETIDEGIKELQDMHDDLSEITEPEEIQNGMILGLRAGIDMLKTIKRNQAAPSICKEFMAYWNSKKKLIKIRSFTKERKAKLITRCQNSVFKDNWKEIIDRLATSDWHTGGNDRGWVADVDYILTNDTKGVKILERPAKKDVAGPDITQAPKGWRQGD